jgi:hypothetical protein
VEWRGGGNTMAPERKVAGRTADVSLSINRYTEKVVPPSVPGLNVCRPSVGLQFSEKARLRRSVDAWFR